MEVTFRPSFHCEYCKQQQCAVLKNRRMGGINVSIKTRKASFGEIEGDVEVGPDAGRSPALALRGRRLVYPGGVDQWTV